MLKKIGCIALPLLGLGLAVLTFHLMVIAPARRVLAARNWVATDCRVISSQFVRLPAPSRRSKLEIRYRYTFNGIPYTSSRYDLMGDSSGGPGGHEAQVRIVARHPPGKLITCYVNPAAPEQATIDRRLPVRMLWGVLPLVFIVAGVLGSGLAILLWRGGDL